jgi:Ca2+-binding RTX toxin-like protein
VTYAEWHTAVDVSANDIPDDGRAGENDNVHSDVEDMVGGPFDDELIGNEYVNRILGGDGNDTLVGGRGKDIVLGMRGDDTLDTEDGNVDRAICGDGNDTANVDVTDNTSACETVNASKLAAGSRGADRQSGNEPSRCGGPRGGRNEVE